MYALTGTAPPLADSRQPDWAFREASDEAVYEEFGKASQENAEALTAIGLAVGHHILREDVPDVLSRAAGRPLSASHLAAILRSFAMDASGTISWHEFERSWHALRRAEAPSTHVTTAARCRASRKQCGGTATAPQAAAIQPATAQQEIGWHHAAAPLQPRARCEDVASRYLPLSGTDVTRGGQGRSAATYFGMYL